MATPKKENPQKCGRRAKYNPDVHPKKAREWIAQGNTKRSIAHALGITASTLYEWQNKHSDFSDAINQGTVLKEKLLSDALFKGATGHVGEDGKYYPPNASLVIFGLKNINSKDWKDKHEVVNEVKLSDMTEAQLDERLKALLGDVKSSS